MNQEKLSQEEVYEVLKWARMIYSNDFFGAFSPQLANKNLLDLNNNNSVPTKEKLDEILKSEVPDADLLRQFSEFAETYDRIFGRTLNYYTNMLSFDLNIVCKNAYRGKADYESKEYKDDLKRVYKFLDNFDYKSEFQEVLHQILRSEIYYTWFRDSEGTFDDTGEIVLDENGEDKTKKLSKYTLQMMPQYNCLLTGSWENGLLYDFDMNYFLRSGISLKSYDPIFKKYWRQVYGDDSAKQKYNPAIQYDKRNGSFAQWVQTSPDDGAWVFKLDMSNYNGVPFLTPLIRDILSDVEMSKLQTDANILAAYGLVVGEIPLMTKQASGETQDAMSWKPGTLMKFMKLVKAGLNKNVNAVAMPTANNKFYQYDYNYTSDIYDNTLSATAGNAASASRIIYTSDKAGQFELQAQIQNDYNFVKSVYPQFEKFLNFYVNKKTRKYKFNFLFSGSNYGFIREQESKGLMDLANVGMVLNAESYAKIVNMRPHDFVRALEAGHYGDLTTKLTMLLNINTQGNTKSKTKDSNVPTESGGRPILDIGERAESTNENYE